MNKTKKVGLTTIAAFAMAACTFATLGMAKGMSASAEEATPVYAEQGWYFVGNGAGSLKDCSWTNYVPEFKLTQTAGEGKTGTFTYSNLTLVQGDAFKILYANGEWQWPSDSGWTADVMAQISDLTTNADGYFTDGGLGNIQATAAGEGIYDFTLTVTETDISLNYKRTGDIVDPVVKEEMYLVGKIASYEDCNWPGSIDVRTCCPALEFDKTTKKWTIEIELAPGDVFKVYNLVNNAYFPSGINNDCKITVADMYTVEYEEAAPSFIVTNSAGVVVYR